MAKKTKKQPLAVRVKSDPALLARALRDPGLRSKLPDSMLTPAQRAQRRGNAPVLPGSTLTNRDVSQQVGAATDLQFGPNAVPLLQQRNRDQAGWYQQYQQDLQRHAQNVAGINRQATDAIGGLSAGIRDIGAQSLGAQAQREAANAQITGATPGDQSRTAGDASMVRQAMIAALGAAEAGRGAAAGRHADTLANVVAPGQRLQAAAAGQTAVRDLADRINAFKAAKTGDLVDAERKSLTQLAADEAKNALALRIAGINADTKTTTAKIASGDRAAGRKADTHRWASQVNKYGVTNGAWAAWGKSDAGKKKRQAAIDAYNATVHPPKTPKTPAAAKPITPEQQRKYGDRIANALHYANQLKALKVDGKPLTEQQVRRYLTEGQAGRVPKFERTWVNIAMDIAYNGYLSPANVKALKALKVNVKSLGYPTKPPKLAAGAIGDAVGAVQGVANAVGGQG